MMLDMNNLLICQIKIQQIRNKQMIDVKNTQIIVIGAGPAGIGAAVTLAQHKIPHIVLQARNRIGGRTLSKQFDGVSVDIGASWIHAQNSLYKNSDESVYESAEDFIENTINNFEGTERRCTNLAINLTQRHQGSSIRQLSAKNFDFKVDEGVNYSPYGGYGQLFKKIAHQYKINVHYQKVVESVSYAKGKVVVGCRDGSQYEGKKVIVSLPLGVLKSKKVKFYPELPHEYLNSIQRLGIGLMNKIVISFQKNFWGPIEWINIAYDERGKFSQIYNFSQNNRNILCCFLTGDFGRKCEKHQQIELLNEFLGTLQKIYGKQNIKVKQYYITNWGKDQFSMGSYTSFHVESSPNDCYQLRKPIQNMLWLIGEYCYAEYVGTAHGAFQTGVWASQQIITSISKSVPTANSKL